MLSSFLALFLTVNSAWAFQSWKLVSSRVYYQIHQGKQVTESVSTETEGKGECSQDKCQFLLGTPLRSFHSGSRSNDLKSLKPLKADLYPILSLDCMARSPIQSATSAVCTLTLAGKSRDQWGAKIESKSNPRGFMTAFEGVIDLKDFGVIDGTVKVFGNILWKQENKYEF